MAQSFVDPIGGELYIPAAYPSITVAPTNGGLATTGVVVLMGEAESGPSFSEEAELGDNSFGADDIQSIVAKYKSGPLVDAAKAAASAAVDPDITQPFSRVIPVKTNTGAKASTGLLDNIASLAYSTMVAKASGANGNLIFYKITDNAAEVRPTSGYYSIVPPCDNVTWDTRISGNIANQDLTSLDSQPNAIQNAISGVDRTGGTQRAGAIPAGTPSLIFDQTGATIWDVTLTLSVDWVGVAVGDTIEIPAGSGFSAADANVGWYVVTSVAGGVVTAIKAGDKSTTAGHVVGGDPVQPVDVGSTPVNVNHDLDLLVWSYGSWTGKTNGDVTGQGRTVEITATSVLGGDTDPRKMFRVLGTTTVAPWMGTPSNPVVVSSAVERKIDLALTRKQDNISENVIVGGEIGLKVGYKGYSCTIVIDSTSVTVTYKLTDVSNAVTVVMGFDAYPTIADVAAYLNSLSGFSAAPGNAVLGNLPSSALDANVWGAFSNAYNAACSSGAQTCRIKTDAYRFRQALVGSYLVELATTPLGGLPKGVAADTFLAGGSKGGTTVADITAAIDSMEQLRCNFVVPCFSRDATFDKADGLTDNTSDYEIDAINAAVKTHVHKMSGMKTKRNRQAFLSKRSDFNTVKESAANIASHRCMMAFEDVKSAVSGSIVQYQPYIASALAASMQAGAFYKSIVRKQVNVTGALQAAGDWTYNLDSKIEDALKAGLNPIRKAEEGGFIWVSDQTTYGKDNKNFYNSIQMVYAGDIVALTTAQRMERAFVGQSVADVSAAVAVSYLDSIMADFLRLKLIAPSSDAPLGYKNAKVVIEGSVMRVSVEVKISGSIYFIPIAFYVTEITQSA